MWLCCRAAEANPRVNVEQQDREHLITVHHYFDEPREICAWPSPAAELF